MLEITLWRPDGSQALFSHSGSDNANPATGTVFINEPGATGTLTYIALPAPYTGSGYQYRRNDGTTELYSNTGRLLSVTNPSGLSQVYQYDSNGRLTAVTDPFGRTLTLAYDGSNRIATLTNPAGGVYTYSYDANGNLASVKYPDGSTIQYFYEDSAFPHALTGIVDQDGERYATWSYDEQGRAASGQNASGANAASLTYYSDGSTDVTEATGLVRHLTFASLNFVQKLTGASAPCTDCGDLSRSLTYDTNGFLSSATDFDGNVTKYVNDASGLETSRTEAAGTQDERTITTQWDTTLRKPTLITEPGKTTAYTYDSAGRMLTKTVTDTATGVNRTTTYAYNGNGLLESVTDPLGHVTQFGYDAEGNLVSITNALG